MQTRSLIVVASLFSAIAFATVQEPVTLRLKIEPNKALKYESHSKIGQEMMGQDMSMTTDMTLNLAPTKAEKGIQTLLTFTGVKLTMPESVPMNPADMAKAFESVKTSIVYDELGKSSDFKFEGDDMAKMMMGSTGGMNTGFLGLQYPENPIKAGDMWKVDFDITAAMAAVHGSTDLSKKTVVPVEYTLTKVENGVATVSAKTKAKIDTQGPNGMLMTISMDSTSEYLIDVATGLPNTITTKGHNTIDFGMGTMDQNVDTTIKKV